MLTRNKEVVQQVNEAFERNDHEAFLALCADDISWTMVGYPAINGKEAVRESLKKMSMGSGLTLANTQMTAEDDRVVCEGTMTATEKDGTLYQGAYCDHYRLKNGRVLEMRSYVIDLSKKAGSNEK